MNDRGRKVCSFCVETLNKDEFDKIQETAKQMLNGLLLKPKLDVPEETVICKICASKLQTAVNFKSICLNKKITHVDFEEDPKSFSEGDKLDENASLELNNVSVDHRICRFCKKMKEHECHSYLQETKENIFIGDMVQTYIPELHSSVTKELMTCKSCLDSLQSLLHFVISYSDIENKTNKYNNRIDIEVKLEPDDIQESILEEELNIVKIEESCVENEDDIAVKNAEDDEYLIDIDNMKLNVKNEKTTFKSEEYHKERYQENANETDKIWQILYKCEICTYKTKRKDNLRRHMVIHKTQTEVNMHKCEVCSFETRHKVSLTRHMVMHQNPSAFKCTICSLLLRSQTNLIRHMVTHQNPSEVDMYHCNTCSYQTKHKNCLIRHMVTHQSRSDSIMYRCDQCTFETRHKGSHKYHMQTHQGPARTIYKCGRCPFESKVKYTYIRHMLIHVRPSEVKLYKCEKCPFKTRHRHGIYVHRLTHKSMSEVKMYHCEKCSFETKYSGNLKQHRLTHESSPEIKKYKCIVCSYETRLRSNLIRHMQIHQNVSEVKVIKGFRNKWNVVDLKTI